MPEEDDLELDDELEIEVDAPLDDVIDPEPEEDELDDIQIEGDETPPEEEEHKAAPKWVKEVRTQNRELKRQLRELQSQPVQVPAVTIGPKPTLEQAEYDADKFEANLLEWTEKKRKADEVQNRAKTQQEEHQKAWLEKQSAYEKSKTSLRVRDYADAEDAVRESLSVEQQSVILDAVDIPAEMVYAIGKRPKLLKELSEIKSLAKFAAKLGVLETKMKVERKSAPEPERVVKSGASSGSAISSTALEKLREESRRTGDMTKYLEAKRRLKK